MSKKRMMEGDDCCSCEAIKRLNSGWLSYEAEMVFIGAGPVGLITAILTQEAQPSLRIVVLEKYTQYQRSQRLKISPRAFEKLPADSNLHSIIKLWAAESSPFWVPIQKAQQQLEELAMELGVHFVKGEAAQVENPRDLPQKFPNARHFIGADGAKSITRKEIFGNELLAHEKLNFQVHISYQVQGSQVQQQGCWTGSDPLKRFFKSPFGCLHTVQMMENVLLEERVFENTIQLVFSVSEQVYLSMEDANQKNPFQFHQMPQSLQSDVQSWLQFKQKSFQEVCDLKNFRAITFPLEAKISKEVICNLPSSDCTFYLVGDSATSFPYRLGFNLGASCAIQLSQVLTGQMEHSEYSNFVQKNGLCTLEKARSRNQNIQLWSQRLRMIPTYHTFFSS